MKRLKKIASIFLILQVVFVKLLTFFSDKVEFFYSNKFYPVINRFLLNLFGNFSFSIGDIIYGALILLLIKWFYVSRINFFINWKSNGLTLLSFISIFYFLFHFLWAINYYRIPLNEKLNINKDYTYEQLISFTKNKINVVNSLQYAITKNKNLPVKIKYADSTIYKIAEKGYENLPNNLKEFSYKKRSIKKSLFSIPLSYMGFGGYFNPFTHEAQFNYNKPRYTLPVTICHEMAHQVGIGSESECNFIGYITANKTNDLYFKYSANCLALRYALKHLERIEANSSLPYVSKLNLGVKKNFEESEIYWKKHDSPISDFFEWFYDNFLKINHQKDGMESYSKFVGLVINYE